MRIHILGICGTFMGGLAQLARESGHAVSGSDAGVYPPMSTLLAEQGIEVHDGYAPEHIPDDVDQVVIGNALSRGNPAVEAVLDRGLPYTSGPEWLADNVLAGRPVLAVAGTHGKTTTSSLLAWMLEFAGQEPGFLIGGVAGNFGISARLGGAGAPFVIEADEYDTAFFDKRPKFVHYRPRTAVINNIEFDHADIFADLAAIEQQFHYFVRTVPGTGTLVTPVADGTVQRVLQRGCWSGHVTIGGETADWRITPDSPDWSRFGVTTPLARTVNVASPLIGEHNAMNVVAAMAAAATAATDAETCAAAMPRFEGVKRRLQVIGHPGGMTLYDDFAHHPSAIRATLAALCAHVGGARIIAVVEPRSNTMKLGVHRHTLAPALDEADFVLALEPAGMDWSLQEALASLEPRVQVSPDLDELVAAAAQLARAGDHLVIMSNGGFGGIHGKLLQRLDAAAPVTGRSMP